LSPHMQVSYLMLACGAIKPKSKRKVVMKMFFYVKGICMMCHKTKQVRHIKLYPAGSEGLFCCSDCENELLEFIREKIREAVKEKIKNFKKKKGGDKQ